MGEAREVVDVRRRGGRCSVKVFTPLVFGEHENVGLIALLAQAARTLCYSRTNSGAGLYQI